MVYFEIQPILSEIGMRESFLISVIFALSVLRCFDTFFVSQNPPEENTLRDSAFTKADTY